MPTSERQKQYQRLWWHIKRADPVFRKRDLEARAKSARTWRAKNPSAYKAYNQAWRENNAEKIKATKKAWYDANKKRLKVANKQWRLKNKKLLTQYQKDYKSEKLQVAQRGRQARMGSIIRKIRSVRYTED